MITLHSPKGLLKCGNTAKTLPKFLMGQRNMSGKTTIKAVDKATTV